jgi:hypothetical protein
MDSANIVTGFCHHQTSDGKKILFLLPAAANPTAQMSKIVKYFILNT